MNRKKIFILWLVLICSAGLSFAGNCSVKKDPVIKLLSKELDREMKYLRKENPPVYYMAYTYEHGKTTAVGVSDGRTYFNNPRSNFFDFSVMVRVGSPKEDNRRSLKTQFVSFDLPTANPLDLFESDNFRARDVIWKTTERAFYEAQQELSEVKMSEITATKRADESDDFVLPEKSLFCREEKIISVDTKAFEEKFLSLSKELMKDPEITDHQFYLLVHSGHRYFVDTVGTRLKTPFLFMRISYDIKGEKEDGSILSRGNNYDALREQDWPSLEKFEADLKDSIAELKALLKAPEAEPIAVPAILKNKAAAVFVHEILGHRMEGHRQKEDDFGKTFTEKIGQPIVSQILTIVDDPTLSHFGKEPLRGFYEYDDEGVKAEPVTIIEKGVLRNFLMNSSPIKNFPRSNGHGRAEIGKWPVARMGNTRVIASETVPYEELEQMLLQEVKLQNKPYGIIVEDLSGGFTQTSTYSPQAYKLEPTLVYRIYPDGRKEMIRGADIVGTPLNSFNKIIAAADDYAVFNGSCGAESGWVPVSGIAPSLLLKELEIEKTTKGNWQPEILPPPFAQTGEQK